MIRKKTFFGLFALLILSIFITQLIGVAATQNVGIAQPSKVPVIILFVSGASESDEIGTVAAVEGEVKHKYSIINGMAAIVPPARMLELQKNPLVLSVDQDIEVNALDINADKQIRADQVWVAGDTGQGIPVAILDTGINNNHPEFSGRISKCHSEITNTNTCEDQNGHGTHTAGIAGAAGNLGTSNSAAAKGVAPNISFYIDQVLDANGNGNVSGIIAGINWAAANGAKVISMSLGTDPVVTTQSNCDNPSYGFSSLRTAINNAVAQGITVVAAAGNSGTNGVGAPACISSTIAVGAVDSTDTIASFSSQGGPMADHGIVAPGVNIFSTLPGGYGTLSGTSMATPVVSGTVALIIKANSSLSPTSPTNQPIRNILFNTACNQSTNPSCPTGAVPNTIYGYGRVDALRVYNAVATPSPTYMPPAPMNLTSMQGNFWINYTWQAGAGNVTDSYNVSVNGTRTNGTISTYSNNSVGPHGWSNITIYAYNSSGTGKLSSTAASLNTQVANNAPVLAPIGPQSVTAGNVLTFTVSAMDADSDPITYSTNAAKGILNATTGVYTWATTTSDVGTYTWSFNASDNYGGVATQPVTITVNTILPAIRYINGTVMDSVTKADIAGVTVSTNTSISTTTNATGFYSLAVTEGTYALTARLDPTYYKNNTLTVSTVGSTVVAQDIELVKKPTGTITGTITNA